MLSLFGIPLDVEIVKAGMDSIFLVPVLRPRGLLSPNDMAAPLAIALENLRGYRSLSSVIYPKNMIYIL